MEKTLLENMLAMRGDISRIGEIVRRHDVDIFPEMQMSLERIESKHNQDYLQYLDSKNEVEDRLIPLEEDLAERLQIKEERGEIILEGKKGAVSNIVSAIIGGGVALLGYLVAKAGFHL